MDDLQNNIQPSQPEQVPVQDMQPQSLEEISGVNAMPATEPEQSGASQDTSEMLKKIILPIGIAVVLGIGGYLVYAYAFNNTYKDGEAPETNTPTDIEDFTNTNADTNTPAIDSPVLDDTTLPSSDETTPAVDVTTPDNTVAPEDITPPSSDTTEPTEDQPIKIPRS